MDGVLTGSERISSYGTTISRAKNKALCFGPVEVSCVVPEVEGTKASEVVESGVDNIQLVRLRVRVRRMRKSLMYNRFAIHKSVLLPHWRGVPRVVEAPPPIDGLKLLLGPHIDPVLVRPWVGWSWWQNKVAFGKLKKREGVTRSTEREDPCTKENKTLCCSPPKVGVPVLVVGTSVVVFVVVNVVVFNVVKVVEEENGSSGAPGGRFKHAPSPTGDGTGMV